MVTGFWCNFLPQITGEIGSLILSWTAQTDRLRMGYRSSKRGRSGAHDPAMPIPVLQPYGEVQPKASSSCFHTIWPSEETATFPARLPSDFSQGGRGLRTTAAAAPSLGHEAGTSRCRHLLLHLGHEEGTLPPLPHRKPL